MKYYVKDRLIPEEEGMTKDISVTVECITRSEFQKRFPDGYKEKHFLESLKHIEYCKADALEEGTIGTFLIPDKSNLLELEMEFGYYMDANQLIFVDDTEVASVLLKEMEEVQIFPKTYVAHVFFEFLEYLIKDDVHFLQRYEEGLEDMEEELLSGKMEDLDKKILKKRRELLKLNAYYQQLSDLSDILEENQNQVFTAEDCRLFGLYSNRVIRLCDNTRMLREYSMQIREMYQSQIDIRQNKVMQFLAVVTTIFMPLTLLVGWYGMNFANMPELRASYGYPTLVIASLFIIIVEILIFKKKKWLK